MKKVILIPAGKNDRGTYKIKGGGKFGGITIWGSDKNGVIADLEASGYKVFEQDWKFDTKTGEDKKILRRI